MNVDDKLFTLSNGKKYIVLESLEYEGKKYAYLSNKDNELDTMFVEFNFENGMMFKEVEKKYLQEKILPLFLEKFSNYDD